MNLFDKLRALVGALAHKPPVPWPAAEPGDTPQGQPSAAAHPTLAKDASAAAEERVADLIAQDRQAAGE